MMNITTGTLDFLLNTTEELILVLNKGLKVQSMSAHAKTLFGREAEDFPLGDICARGDCEAVADIIAHEELRALPSAELQALFMLPDGREMPAKLFLHRLSGLPAGERSFLALIEPLAHRGARPGIPPTAELRASSTEPILLINEKNLEIVDCNKAAEALFGLRREEILGPAGPRFASFGDRDRKNLKELRLQIESVGVIRSKFTLRGPWNSIIDCEVTGIAQYDDEGALVGILCILRDLGEELALLSKVRRIALSMRSCMRELDALTSSFPGEDSSGEGCITLEALGLSLRQVEVARLVVAGETTKAIAHRLGLSESCVKSHITGLFKKTGTKTRAQLIAFFHASHISLD